jgi:hypothetical protein
MPASATKVVDHLADVAANEVESSLSPRPVIDRGQGQVLLDPSQLHSPTTRCQLVTLHRGDGQAANPRHVYHVGNDIVAAWARELFAHSSEHSSSQAYRCAVDGHTSVRLMANTA